MKVRYYIDSEIGAPHIYNHRVSGWFLRAIYVPDPAPRCVFVFTARYWHTAAGGDEK